MDQAEIVIQERVKECMDAISSVSAAALARAAERITVCLQNGGKALFCGNGGSMEQAAHFAGELLGRFKKNRPPLAGVALGANTAALTAIANDFEFTDVFSREIRGIGKEGDVLVALSTSGNSPNVLRAVKAAKEMNIATIGLSGTGGKLNDMVDISLALASAHTPRIQEAHLLMIHILAELVEEAMFPESFASRF